MLTPDSLFNNGKTCRLCCSVYSATTKLSAMGRQATELTRYKQDTLLPRSSCLNMLLVSVVDKL